MDGIFGPLAKRAITSFQENVGLQPTGICTPETLQVLERVGSQSGNGPGIAVVREAVTLSETVAHGESRLVVGYFAGMAALAHAVSRRVREDHPLTSIVDLDAQLQAAAANQLGADSYIGFEVSGDPGCTFQFYEVPTFVSTGGRNLARRLCAAVADRVPEVSVQARGARLPVLRETKMPAVLCSMGPTSVVGLKVTAIAHAVTDAWIAWTHDPLAEV